MYSKEEAQQLKKEFWSTFGNEFPRKWILYNTEIKDFAFKFYIDNKKAQVQLDIEMKDDELRKVYFEKIESLQSILKDEFLPNVILERNFHLENGKLISRIWVELTEISMNRKSDWQSIYNFYYEQMDAFERFYFEYEDYIKDLDLNT